MWIEKFTTPTTIDDSFSASIKWYGDSNFCLIFKKSYLKQRNRTFTPPNRIIINLHPSGYSQELHYYQFAVNLDGCLRSCSTLNDLSNKVCVSNKTKDLNLSTFYMNTGISCECKCKFDS